MDNNNVVIVTGANSGMGKAISIEIAKTGAALVMLCKSKIRREEALKEVRALNGSDYVELMLADLGSPKSIENFCMEFKKKHQRLDVLINNAGVILPGRHETVDGYELQFGVNHLGHFLLTNRLLDLLIATSQEVDGITAKYFYRRKPITSSTRSYDKIAAKKLWDLSESMTNFNK